MEAQKLDGLFCVMLWVKAGGRRIDNDVSGANRSGYHSSLLQTHIEPKEANEGLCFFCLFFFGGGSMGEVANTHF